MALYSDRNIIYSNNKAIVEEFEDIYQALWNLIETETGARLFNDIGVNLRYYLKKPCTVATALSMKQYFSTVFKAEPRVTFNLNKSEITPIPNKKLYTLKLVFNILGINSVDNEKTMDLILFTTDA